MYVRPFTSILPSKVLLREYSTLESCLIAQGLSQNENADCELMDSAYLSSMFKTAF